MSWAWLDTDAAGASSMGALSLCPWAMTIPLPYRMHGHHEGSIHGGRESCAATVWSA
jgi:hypothetical protein